MIIQHNMPAANTNRMLGITNSSLAKSTEKLSSGYRVNRAGDDAAGLSISEKMRGQIRGLNQASRNAQDGISLIQTAEGAMDEIHSIIQRMRELTVQAANDTNETEDRAALAEEVQLLSDEITRISGSIEFNKKTLLNGDYADEAIQLQVGANSGESHKIEFTIASMAADSIGEDGIDVTGVADTITGATHRDDIAADDGPLDTLDLALEAVSKERSKLGATQNRLEHTIANLDNGAENLQASESRIRDVNMADEMVNYSKDTILQQAAQSMLAQANQQTQGVLALLQ